MKSTSGHLQVVRNAQRQASFNAQARPAIITFGMELNAYLVLRLQGRQLLLTPLQIIHFASVKQGNGARKPLHALQDVILQLKLTVVLIALIIIGTEARAKNAQM